MYRRPILCTLHGAVDFLKFLMSRSFSPKQVKNIAEHYNLRRVHFIERRDEYLLYTILYQIRRPLGLVFVIYFWWLGELLLLYI